MLNGVAERKPNLEHAERRVIAQNFLWLTAAQVAGRVVGLFTSIYVRRTLQVVAIGQYSWCVSILSYFSLITNPGLETIAKRDVARDPRLAAGLFSRLLAVELGLAALALLLVGVFSATALRGPTVSALLILLSIGLVLAPFNPSWLLLGREHMAAPGITQVTVQILKLPALIWLVQKPEHVFRYAVLDYPFQLLMIGFLLWYADRHHLIRLRDVRPAFRSAWPLLTEALPVGLSQAAILLYYNFDVILLGIWRGDKAVGLYSTAYGLMLVPTVVSGTLSSAYFPRLSRGQGDDRQSAKVSSEFLRIISWMGMPIAALGWAFGRHVVILLYGRDFAASGPLLEWLSLNIALIFFNVGVGNPFDAWGLQFPHFKVGCAGAALNVALNFILIPRFGAPAAVATTLIAELVVGAGCLAVRNTHVRLAWWSIVWKPVIFSLAAALIGRCLVFESPDQWLLSLLLVTSGVILTFCMSERSFALGLLRSFRELSVPTEAM